MSLIETTQPPVAERLPTTLRLGAVHLTVAGLDRAVAWCQRPLGLRVHSNETATAELGDGVETVVVLHEDPRARRGTVRLPTDADVAQVRERVAAAGQAAEQVAGGFEVRDPWGAALAIVSVAGASTGADR